MNKLLEKLEEMGAETEDTIDRLMGDEEMYLEFIMKFPQNENIIELKKAVEAKDAEKAMKEVHTLKGVALNLGFLPLLDVCMDMLLDFREGDVKAAFSQMNDVENCFNEWKAVIKEYEDI